MGYHGGMTPYEHEVLTQLNDLILLLEELPAERSDEFLALLVNKGQRIKGLAETERFARVLMIEEGEL